jgi:hypothetical protein
MTVSKSLSVPLPAELSVTYRGRSRKRLVLIGVDSNGVWVVYDVAANNPSASGVLVDRLLGDQEKASHAHALAVEYAACQTAFHAGRRDEQPTPNPLPKATRVPRPRINEHTQAANRALRRATGSPEPPCDSQSLTQHKPSRTSQTVAA